MQQAFQGTEMTFTLAEFILKLQKQLLDLERQLCLPSYDVNELH